MERFSYGQNNFKVLFSICVNEQCNTQCTLQRKITTLLFKNALTKIFWFTLFRFRFLFIFELLNWSSSRSGVCGHMRHVVYGTLNDNFGFVYEAKMVEIFVGMPSFDVNM
jgi:hypothetical protein